MQKIFCDNLCQKDDSAQKSDKTTIIPIIIGTKKSLFSKG